MLVIDYFYILSVISFEFEITETNKFLTHFLHEKNLYASYRLFLYTECHLF